MCLKFGVIPELKKSLIEKITYQRGYDLMAKLSDLIKENDSKTKKEQIGLAEHFYKLSQDLEKAKENPALKAVEQLEKDRKELLDTFLQYDSVTLDKKISELEAKANSPLIQSALNQTSFIDSILEATKIHDLDKLQESLGFDYKQYLKPELSATQKAIESIQQTINNPTIQSSIIEEASKLASYESQIGKISEAIAKNQNLFESSKGLAALGQQMANDSLKYKMEEQSKFNVPDFSERIYEPIIIPENPMIGQNEEIISLLKNLQEQNNTLIQFEKSDQEIQKISIELTNKIQTNNEIMIQELKAQNENLETQLSQKEVEIEQNRKDNIFTRKVAIWGIGISILVGLVSSVIPFYISNQERLENDKDNEKLVEVIGNKSIENQNMTMLLKEMQLQNKINKNIEDNQIKFLMKAIEFQNEYFKKKETK